MTKGRIRIYWLVALILPVVIGIVGVVKAEIGILPPNPDCVNTPVTTASIANYVQSMDGGGRHDAPWWYKACMQYSENQGNPYMGHISGNLWTEPWDVSYGDPTQPAMIITTTTCTPFKIYAGYIYTDRRQSPPPNNYTPAPGPYSPRSWVDIRGTSIRRSDGTVTSSGVNVNRTHYDMGDVYLGTSKGVSSSGCVETNQLKPGINTIYIDYCWHYGNSTDGPGHDFDNCAGQPGWGSGPWFFTVNYQPPAPQPQGPSANSYCDGSTTKVTFNWAEDAASGNATYIDYDRDNDWNNGYAGNVAVGGDGTSKTVTNGIDINVSPGTNYHLRAYYPNNTNGFYHSLDGPNFTTPNCQPPAPTFTQNCVNGSDVVSISWSSSGVSFVDITDSGSGGSGNWGNPFWSRGVSGNSTTAPGGFNGYGRSDALVFNASRPYWLRTWDGNLHSLDATFDAINCPKPFTATPFASVTLDDDIFPQNANFSSGFNLDRSARLTVTQRYFIDYLSKPDDDLSSPPNDSRLFGATSPSATYPTSRSLVGKTLLPGDKICVRITITPGSGLSDASGNVTNPGPPATTSPPDTCVTIANKPYLKVYGGSAWAGGKFASGSCTPASGKIMTQAFVSGGTAFGSSAQYAVMAFGAIEGTAAGPSRGFISAIPFSPAKPSGYLTFANTNPPFTPASSWGGSLGYGHCLVDFFDTTSSYTRLPGVVPNPLTAGGTYDLSTSAAIVNGKQHAANGNLTITASGNVTKRVTIYVRGNVLIDSDINYGGNYNDSKVTSIPYVTVIASGNILIGKNVQKLSGLYIAQPNATPNTGQIYTCTNGFTLFANNDLFKECNGLGTTYTGACNTGKPLSIFGAFIASKVNFLRTNGTLRCANPTEDANTINAAEKFYLAPELYLGEPVFRTRTGQSGNDFGDAHSYSTLPPVF